MTSVNSDIIHEFRSRGLLSQVSAEEELTGHLASGSRTVYCGFDPTADSLHIGSLVPLLALRRFQLAGHKPIAVAGGATGMIGDPSFKSNERKLNSAERRPGPKASNSNSPVLLILIAAPTRHWSLITWNGQKIST